MPREARKGRELLGLPVFTILEGKRLGAVGALLVRREDSTVAAVSLSGGSFSRAHVLPYEALRTVGQDAVLVDSEAVLNQELAAEAARTLDSGLAGRPVITRGGQRLGAVMGFRVDTTTGRILTYRIRPESGVFAKISAALMDRGVEIPVELVDAVGDHAVVVQDGAADLGSTAEEVQPTASSPAA